MLAQTQNVLGGNVMSETVPLHVAQASAQDNAASLFILVTNHLLKGEKINAIKIFRQHTGLGLKESKDAIENMIEASITCGTLRTAVVPPVPATPDYRIVFEDNDPNVWENRTIVNRLNVNSKAEALEEARRRAANAGEFEEVTLVQVIAKSKRTISMVEA